MTQEALYIVTEKAERPNGRKGLCFYCGRKVGESHAFDCVLISKKVRLRMTVEYEVRVPAHWDKDRVEFHRNESSWCADNAVAELQELLSDDSCTLCGCTEFEMLEVTSEPFLSE